MCFNIKYDIKCTHRKHRLWHWHVTVISFLEKIRTIKFREKHKHRWFYLCKCKKSVVDCIVFVSELCCLVPRVCLNQPPHPSQHNQSLLSRSQRVRLDKGQTIRKDGEEKWWADKKRKAVAQRGGGEAGGGDEVGAECWFSSLPNNHHTIYSRVSPGEWFRSQGPKLCITGTLVGQTPPRDGDHITGTG